MSHVTNPNQLAPPLPRKIEPVGKIAGFNKVDGSPALLSARELTAYEFGEHVASMRDEFGQQTAEGINHSDLKWLAQVLCDAQGNRLWHDPKSLVDQLGQYPKSVIDQIIVAAQKVNAGDVAAVDRAEKNSEETASDSPNGTSPSSSDIPALVS
jgi:hypothetical protein